MSTGRRLWPGGHELLATAIGSLAFANYQAGRNEEAAPLFEESVAMHRRLTGDSTLELAYVLSNYGNFLRSAGRGEESVSTLERVASIYRDVAAAERAVEILSDEAETNRQRVAAHRALASAYHRAGRYAEAAALYRRLVGIHRQSSPSDRPDLADALHGLGIANLALGEPAAPGLADALAIREATQGTDHPDTVQTRQALAEARRSERVVE